MARLLVAIVLLVIGVLIGLAFSPWTNLSLPTSVAIGAIGMTLYSIVISVLLDIDNSAWAGYLFNTAAFVFLRLLLLDLTNFDPNVFEMFGAVLAGLVYGLAGFMFLAPFSLYAVTGHFGRVK